MSEFIGSRISLISKSDVRYVGTLHEINSEESTVALENVKSFGTEGRKASQGKADDEIPPSDSLYDYIVFRGGDVKDLRIEDAPKEPAPPAHPLNDPAILHFVKDVLTGAQLQQQSGSRPPPPQNYPPPGQQNFPPPSHQNNGPFQQPYPPPMYPQYGFHPNDRFSGPPNGRHPGFAGPPPGGFQQFGGPYGPPPGGWYPPPGQGYPGQPPQFSPSHEPLMPRGGPGTNEPPQVPPNPPQQAELASTPAQRESAPKPPTQDASAAPSKKSDLSSGPAVPLEARKAARIAVDDAQADRPAGPEKAQATASPAPKTNLQSKVALPFAAVAAKNVATPAQPPVGPKVSAPGAVSKSANEAAANAQLQYQNAARAATAAVAAAMAKLPPLGSTNVASGTSVGMDNLTQKVNEMRVDERTRNGRGRRGDRGGQLRGRDATRRGGRGDHQGRGLEVPTTDFDFESANAKFNKEDLVREAIASGEPIITAEASKSSTNGSAMNGDGAKDEDDIVIPPAPVAYNKSSFFDNISSEAKDREEGNTANRTGFRGEERRRNLETFGLGSVDAGLRGGFQRGRGRGRGFRGGPGGGFGRGRGGMRGRGGGGLEDAGGAVA